MARLSEENVLNIKLHLRDQNPEILEAWRIQFERHQGITISEGSVLDAGAEACLCPGNAFGFMDSGLALALSETIGWHLQEQLRECIRSRYDGELLVGQAIVIATGKNPPWLVYAATMRTPQSVDGTLNAYHALRGTLLAIRDHNLSQPEKAIETLAVPGLCTGTGGMPPVISARQMRHIFEQVTGLRGFGDKNLSQLTRREIKLKALPKSMLEDEHE